VHARINESRGVWLVGGIVIGLGVAYFWPHEPLRADQSDRNDKFAMLSVPATSPIGGLPTSEAIFVLDFLTGKLQGFFFSPAAGGFTQTWYRDVAADLQLGRGSAQGNYAICGGQGQVTGQGVQWGSSLIYVAELSTGQIIVYGFPFTPQNQQTPTQQLAKVGVAQFRGTQPQ
jgi:hypothetical protein